MSVHRVIHIHPEAPPKPALGAPCNGCGVCCLAEPCPVGMLVSRRWRGACAALRWDAANAHYRCGVLADATDRLHRSPAQPLRPWLLQMAVRGWHRWVARSVGAGVGCDAALTVQPPSDDKA